MNDFVLTPAAEEDLLDIDQHLLAESTEVADRVSRAFEDAMTLLAASPWLGHARADLTHRPFRFWPVYSYLIVYEPQSPPIRIVRVIHGARDVVGLLAP